jgi:insulysin
MINACPGNALKARLYCELVRDSLNEYAYGAGIAGLQYSLGVCHYGLGVDISGYNDKMLVLLETVLVKMRDLEVLPDRFKLIKERLMRSYRNWDFAQPYYQAGEYARYLHSQQIWLNEEYLEELSHITLEDVKLFFPQALQQFHLEALVHGNLYKEVCEGQHNATGNFLIFELGRPEAHYIN